MFKLSEGKQCMAIRNLILS